MIMTQEDTCALLDSRRITYERYKHDAAYTIEDLNALAIPNKERIVKNLFLRDDKNKNFYLVTIPGHKPVNLKRLAEIIPSRRLSFASEEVLLEMLALRKGYVTPLGILNNFQKNVVAVIDRCLDGEIIGIHPMENTTTIFLAFEDVKKLLEEHGNTVVLCDIDE